MLERILKEINYDRVTGTINVDGVKIFVNLDLESDANGTYAISKNGNMYSITITGKTLSKTFPCAMFEIFRNIGYIFFDRDGDIVGERGYYYKSDFLSDNTEYLLKEMWVDKFALKKRECGVSVEKALELVHKDDILKVMPDAANSIVNERVKEVNSEIKFRRQYLDFLKDSFLEKNPEIAKIQDKNKKKISPMEKRRLKQGLEEAAMAMGYLQEEKMVDLSPNTFSQIMTRMRIANVPNRISFEDGAKMIIKAMDKDNVHPGLFNIQTHRYVAINNIPENWKTGFGKYYFKSGSVYVLYTKTNDGKMPEFMEGNTYERHNVNRAKVAFDIISKYERVVNDLLKPALKKYQQEIYVDKRDVIAKATVELMSIHILHENSNPPTINDLDNQISELNMAKADIPSLKKRTSGMMSYNERKKAFMETINKRAGEDDDTFKIRCEQLWEAHQHQQQREKSSAGAYAPT